MWEERMTGVQAPRNQHPRIPTELKACWNFKIVQNSFQLIARNDKLYNKLPRTQRSEVKWMRRWNADLKNAEGRTPSAERLRTRAKFSEVYEMEHVWHTKRCGRCEHATQHEDKWFVWQLNETPRGWGGWSIIWRWGVEMCNRAKNDSLQKDISERVLGLDK